MLKPKHSRLIGKTVKKALKFRGGGSALPGLIVEKLDPEFLKRTLSGLPHGVVVISGTNGKTTTTKMVVQLLRAEGLKVFTNPTGSNFTRGIAASLLDAVSEEGVLEADIAVIELDEAHAVPFVRQIPPRHSLILNVLRDQLDRFGEIDHTAKLLSKVVDATSDGVVLNREDPLVRALGKDLPLNKKVQYFGLSDSLKKLFPSDQGLHGEDAATSPPHPHRGDVILRTLKGNTAKFEFGEKLQPAVTLKLDGAYNVLNAAAALALVRIILGDAADTKRLLKELEAVRPAFGRGEAIDIDGQPLEIVLVKNPSGFRLALKSYAQRPAATMIAINDNYADGRDMSWLWDVDFSSLRSNESGVSMVSGVRAYDMALRLQYDDVTIGHVETGLPSATDLFLTTTTGPRRIYCTYTAMLALRRHLAKTNQLEPIV
jgi:UDP-N-acetylmuramyl tripeptide synthase